MSRKSIFIPIFLLSLTIPVFFFVGPLRLSAYRAFLLIGLFPALMIWLTNQKIPKILPDFLILFFPFWAMIALARLYGMGFAVEAGGMFFIETVGPYFIARVLVQNADRFEQIMRWLIGIVIVLLPFAVFEAVTKREILIELFRVVGSTYSIVAAPERWGLDRVQGPFEHPIHFGVYCGVALSFAFYYKAELQSVIYRTFRAIIILFTALWSLSSGPLTGISAQILLIVYDLATRSITLRWRYLIIGVVVMWVVVDLLSNRTPPEVFITYFAFSAHTAYNRINIWRYGSQSVVDNPLFGIGYEEYARPDHVYSASVDMFWILPSMQFGMPAGFALLGVFIFIVIKVGTAKISDPRVATLRKSAMICFVGIILSGWTVHYWAAMWTFVLFIFASGIWFFTHAPDDNQVATERLGTVSDEETNELGTSRENGDAKGKAGRKGYSRKSPSRTRLGYTRRKLDD